MAYVVSFGGVEYAVVLASGSYGCGLSELGGSSVHLPVSPVLGEAVISHALALGGEFAELDEYEIAYGGELEVEELMSLAEFSALVHSVAPSVSAHSIESVYEGLFAVLVPIDEFSHVSISVYDGAEEVGGSDGEYAEYDEYDEGYEVLYAL